mgnify:CR=1 FL=1
MELVLACVRCGSGNRHSCEKSRDSTCRFYLGVSALSDRLFAMLALMLPVQLKYGGEKGRLVIVIAVAVILCVAIGSAKFMERANVDASGTVEWIAAHSVFSYGLLVAVLLALLWISYRISLHVMEKNSIDYFWTSLL